MNAVKACKLIIRTLRALNRWNHEDLNKIYDLAYKFVRENEIKEIK